MCANPVLLEDDRMLFHEYIIADLSGVILFGASVSEMFIRDKFGQSAMSKLVIAELAVPISAVILVRVFQ